MLKRILISIFLLAACTLLVASELLDGTWQGELELPGGVTLKLIFTINQTSEGVNSTLSIPQQGVTGLPVDQVVYIPPQVIFHLDSIGARYTAQVKLGTEATIVGTFVQMGLSFPLTLERQGEVAELRRTQHLQLPLPYLSEEHRFVQEREKFTLAGTITRPADNQRHPAVVLLTGSGSQDRDETIFGHKPFLLIADALTRANIVVLRFDDRGVGSSAGNPSNATSVDLSFDAESAFTYLQKQPFVDPTKVGLLGHSEGALLAAMVAQRRSDVAFITMLAGPGLDGIALLKEQTRALLQAQGAPTPVIDSIVALNLSIYQTVIDSTLTLAQRKTRVRQLLASSGMQKEAIEAQLEALFSPWYLAFLQIDPQDYIKTITAPVLALNGSLDTQVTAEANLAAIAKALRRAGNLNYQTKVYEGLNHLFQAATTGAVTEYAEIETTIEEFVLADIVHWIKTQVGVH